MKKGKKWKKIEAFCILLIVTLLLIFVRILYQPGTESERGELYTFSNGWYQLKDGKKTELKLPCFVTADKDGQIILYNDMLSEADKGKILSIRGIQDQLEVCIGDRLLYQYKDNRFEKNRQMKGKIWADISLPEKIGQERAGTEWTVVKSKIRLCIRNRSYGRFFYGGILMEIVLPIPSHRAKSHDFACWWPATAGHSRSADALPGKSNF